jgi:NADPH:quinone reductase-like Zn-dependent oxidoreductase
LFIFVADISNEKTDWLHLTALNVSLNSGDDIAGVVHALGSDVAKTKEYAIGDRVAAFHPMMSAHGAFAEYAVAPYHTVFKIPDETSFEGKLWKTFNFQLSNNFLWLLIIAETLEMEIF